MTTDLNRIAEALRQADAAGDVEGARKLASYYRQAAQAAAAAPAADQPGRLGSFASSVGRGALSVIPGTVGGVGYALGSDTLTGAADTIEGGINRMLPVNPEYQDELLMKGGQAFGQAIGMLGTGGLVGTAGKGLAVSRGLSQAAAAAKGTNLAKNLLLGTGVAQGIRGGGQAAEQYGMEGGTAYARALLGGAIEGASERYLFGMGTELAPVKKLLGDAAEKGVGGIVKAAGTEAGEEAAAQIGGNVATSILAPYGVQTPGAFEGAGEAALLGGIAGGTIGGINALIQPSPTIEGETMVSPAGTEPQATAAQEPEDDFGLAAFQQEIEQIVQNPDPIVPLQQTINQAAVTSVTANANLLPATAAVIEAAGLAPAPTPVATQPAPAPQPTREEQLAQLINKARLGLSANERADMEQQLAEERQKAISREQPTPTIEETTPPVEPIPAVEEDAAPEITSEEVPNVENVIDEPGAAEVGSGMEETPVSQIKNAPKRINLAGAEFDVVAVNEDGTLRVRNDEGGEFDTSEGEAWTEVMPPSKISASDVTKMSREEFIKKEIDAAVFAKKLAIQEAEQAIRNKWTPKKPLPVGVSKVTAFLTKTRYTPDEKKLLHAYNFAQRMRGAEAVRDIAETKGAVWDELSRKQKETQPPQTQPAADKQAAETPGKAEVEGIPQEGKYSVYQSGGRWLIQQSDKRGFGDQIVDSQEEAVKESLRQQDMEQQNKAFFDKQQAKEDAEKAEQEAKDKPLNDYLDDLGLTVMQRGKLKKTLQEGTARRSSEKNKDYTGPREKVIREMVEDGYVPKTEKVKAIKDLTGRQSNRMDNRQQAEFERKQKDAGTKTEYMLETESGARFIVTKAEHDYAQWLKSKQQPIAAPAPQAEQPAPQRDTSKPEQMTPEEWGQASKDRQEKKTLENIARIEQIIKVSSPDAVGSELRQLEKLRISLEQNRKWTTAELTGNHPIKVEESVGIKKPVSKTAVDAYGITLPEGYVAEGELYVYRPGGEVKADKMSDEVEGVETAPVAEAPTAPAPAKVEAEAPKAAPAQAAPKPAPTEAAEPGVVPIANDPVDAQRAALGLPPIMRMTKEAYTFQQMWSDAEAAMAANPERGKTLVKTLNDKPRNISALEDAILLRERVNRVNALDLAMVEFNQAPKGNNEDQRKALDEAITSLTELDNALAVAGTEQGRSLNARKMLARQDYTLAKMISTLRAANDGDLSEADIATITRLQKRLKDVQDQRAEVESGQADLLSDRLAEAEKVAFEAGRQEVLKDIEDRAKADAAKVAEMQKRKAEYLAAKKEATEKPSVLDAFEKSIEQRIASRRGKLYSDVLLLNAAADAADYVLLGAVKIAKGVTKLSDWVISMRGSGIDLNDAEMEQLFKESKAYDAGEGLPVSEAPLKTRKTKAPAIDKVKAIAADEEALDSRTVYNLVVEKMKKRVADNPALEKVEMSTDDLTSVISEVTKDVQEFFSGITEREIRDLFSGYGIILKPSSADIAKQMRQLTALGRLQSAIEDAEVKRAPLKSGPQRDKATQAIRLQQKKLARELRMMGREYEAGEEQLRSPLDAIKARLSNQIDDLAFEINTRKKIARRPATDYDPEAKALAELRDELKRISDFVNAPAGPTFAELVQDEKDKLDKRIGDLEKALENPQLMSKPDRQLYTQELQVKRDERDRLSKLVAQARKKAIGDTRTQEEIDRVAVSETKKAIAELERKIADKDLKRPESRTPTETAEYKALIDEKKKLQGVLSKMRQEAEGRQGMSDEQRIKMATAAIDKSIERMQKMLTSGNYDVPKRTSKTPETPELAQKREDRKALRKQLLELRKLKREAEIDPIAKQLKTDKKRIQTRMDKLKKRMETGDFSKPVKRQKATDQELLDLQVKEEELKEQWAKIVFERYLASRGPGKKILDAGQQTINTARAILTSFDVSAVLRQGGFIVLGNPVRGFRNLGPMFQAFGSDKFAKEEKFRLQNRENFKNGAYQQSKLFLADVNKVDQMSKQEEDFMSRWIDKIPKGARGLYLGSAIQGSQRAYTVFLNRLRMDTFDAMVANLKKGSEPTPQEMSAAANFINIATGRGDLGKFNQAGTALNTVFFAPRLVASRFQILAGYPYFTASGRTKALVLREYAKFFTGALLVYALGMLAQDDEDEPIETDPRSSDFLKIRFGDTRVDPLSGLIQATVLVSRLVSGEKKQASGKIVPIRGEKVPYGADDSFDVMGNFARTKFSPIVGSLVNVITGKNVVGETTDVVEETKRMLVPMSFTEMKETFESQGIPEATALTTLQLFGMGVQTYTPGKK
jgi:hypothetical protein